ncbi:MAG: alpha/beta fold hydrolase BchO [Shimia sp.]
MMPVALHEAGTGDTTLYLHGAGGSKEGWVALAAALPPHHAAAPDLPGHGGTPLLVSPTLRALTDWTAELIAARGWHPTRVVAHSAGAAVALRLALDGAIPGARIITINAALASFPGLAGLLFPMTARALSATPVTPTLIARMMRLTDPAKLVAQATGSTLPPGAREAYRRLFTDEDHIAGTLSMMAHWDLEPLLARLHQVAAPVTLLTGAQDMTVPPGTSARVAARIPGARHVDLPGLGHLAHEEDPEGVAQAITEMLAEA